jgi:tetratricopeptide (TPR) repeat protein
MPSAVQVPLQVFISYAHEDEDLRHELVKHLSQLQRDGLIQVWLDRRITGGSEWAGQIDEHLNSADIVVLLVSPDFLASEYCYDVETKRALERHDAGEARVVPVILRPSDWQTSRFAKLNILPEDAKPVVDWKTHDHGFVNVVDGLQRVAKELRERGAGPALSRPVVQRVSPGRPMRYLAVAGVLIALAIAAAWFWWAGHQRREQERQYVALGDANLNVGRYEDARGPYQQALGLDPGNAAASLGIQIVDVARLKPDPLNFAERLKALLQQAPKDAHLKVLEGDYFAGQGRLDDALSRYQEAANLDPNLAQAYFSMGWVYDQRQDMAHAMPMYQRAVKLAPSSPQYACSLADQYFKRGDYDDAIRVFGGTRQFPLAALESAKIYRLKGDLKAAEPLQHQAVDWLDDHAVASTPENRLPWSIESGGAQPASLAESARICYAHLEYSATLYLDDDETRARQQSDKAEKDCGARFGAVKSIVRWEMQNVAGAQSQLAVRTAAYNRKFLSE